MNKTANNQGGSAVSIAPENAVTVRIFRTMMAAVALAVIISVPFAPWRITSGLLLGGLLSLLNHQWLQSSVAATFELAQGLGTKPRIKLAKYFLRYLVVVAVVLPAYKLNLVSLAATIAGLCSFVVALFVEAFREFYFAIIHREEIS